MTFMMIDEEVAYASPSSVYRVLAQAGRLDRWNKKPSKKGTGFVQPLCLQLGRKRLRSLPNDERALRLAMGSEDVWISLEVTTSWFAAALDETTSHPTPLSLDTLRASIDPKWIEQALSVTGRATLRRQRLPAETVIWLVLGMALQRDRPRTSRESCPPGARAASERQSPRARISVPRWERGLSTRVTAHGGCLPCGAQGALVAWPP